MAFSSRATLLTLAFVTLLMSGADAAPTSHELSTNKKSKKSSMPAKEGGHLSMIGDTYLQHQPNFSDDIQPAMMVMVEKMEARRLGKNKTRNLSKKQKKSKSARACDPMDVELADYPQWQAERGYWIGEYTFLNGDGDAFVSGSWNYPYDHYKGFITGDISGNSYRQRNVFLYPPQDIGACTSNDSTAGAGECGMNGNTKIFSADQSATSCSDNEELYGDIEGLYQGLPTNTELVGKDNALLYQVFFPAAFAGAEGPDRLLQSQLTTITETPSGQTLRTRTAQGYSVVGPTQSLPTSVSFYRERKVEKAEFYAAFEAALVAFNIRTEDMCVWDNRSVIIEGATGSIETCMNHLEQSFEENFGN